MPMTTRPWWVGALLCSAVSGLTVLTATLCREPLRAVAEHLAGDHSGSRMPLETMVAAVAAAGLAACTAWLALTTTAAVVEILTGLGCSAVRSLTPEAVRRLAVLCCGLALSGGGGLGAAAQESAAGAPGAVGRPAQGASGEAVVLDGLLLPDRATGAAPTARERFSAALSARPPAYRVRTGDSLWSIAERLLPPRAEAARVDHTWRTIYRTNRAEVGPDPDLLHPGTTLLLPRMLPRPSSGDGAPTSGTDRKDLS
jgi:hypothetical protein